MIEFTVVTRLVGMGCVGSTYRSVFGPDIEFYRKEGKICIPGSSFKGALRSSANRVAEPYGFTSCNQVNPDKMQQCDVCQVFGIRGGSSPNLLFRDLEQTNSARSTVITRVKLNDKSMRAEEGALYSQEHAHSAEFTGKIVVLGPEKRLLGLLLLAMAELRSGRVGRDTLMDLRLQGTEELEREVDERWKGLLDGLKHWLWEGRM